MPVGVQGAGQQQDDVGRLGQHPVGGLQARGDLRCRAGRPLRRAGVPGAVDRRTGGPQRQRADNAGQRAARPDGDQHREGVNQGEQQQQQWGGQQVAARPVARAQAQGQPRAADEDGQLEADQGEHAEVLAGQQAPARHRLGQEHRRRPGLEELGDQPRRPDDRQEHAEGPGPQRQHRFEEADGLVLVTGHVEADGAEGDGELAAAGVEPRVRLLVAAVQLDLAGRGDGGGPVHADRGAEQDDHAAGRQQQPEGARRQRLAEGVARQTADAEQGGGEIHASVLLRVREG